MLRGPDLGEKGLSQTLIFSEQRAQFCPFKSTSPRRSQPMGGLEGPGPPPGGAWPEAVTQRGGMTPGREGGWTVERWGRKEKKQIKPGRGVTRYPRLSESCGRRRRRRRRRRGWAPEEPAQQGLETTIQGAKSCRRGRKRPEAQRKSDSGRAPRSSGEGTAAAEGGLADPPLPTPSPPRARPRPAPKGA